MVASKTKLSILAIVIVAIVVVGGGGSYLISYKSTGPSTTAPASVTISTAAQATTTGTTVAPIQWITVGQVKPINYYLTLLESNGTEPYVQLARELRKLPDLTNASAVAKITYLALNATNPEVKEAFQLMLNGGTPDPRDFRYVVPNYNTELEVLYWLACQSELKKDDTLALAIGMVDGFQVTMGNEQVRKAVYEDVNKRLLFFREIDDLEHVPYRLSDYPLEALVALVNTNTNTAHRGTYSLRQNYISKNLDLEGYQSNAVSVATLRMMISEMLKRSAGSAEM